jgi:hypothetical protein
MRIWAEVTSETIIFHYSLVRKPKEEGVLEFYRNSINQIQHITREEIAEIQGRNNGTCCFIIDVPEVEKTFVLYCFMVNGHIETISNTISVLEEIFEQENVSE